MDAFGRQDISDLGFDPNLNKTGNVNPSLPSLGLSSSLIPDVTQSPSTPSPVQQGNVQSQQITGGDLSDIIFSGKSTFASTVPGYRMGIDPVDHVFKWFIGNTVASVDFGVTNPNVLTFNVSGNPATSNAIFIQDASPSAWPAVDIRRTTGTGSGIYIQNDSPTGYSLDILNASDTPAVHVISSGSGASVVPLQLQRNNATSTNFYEEAELRGGTVPAVSVSLWAANNTTPNGTLSAGKGDICLSSNGNLYVNTDGGTTWATFSTLATPVTVPNGGTGDTSLTAYAVLCGGTTSTAAVQSVASVGTSGQVLTSNGAGALPTFQSSSVVNSTVLFGDESDGSVTYDGAATILGVVPVANVYTLSRDIFVTNMTVNNGVTVKTQGWRIFGAGTLTNNGSINGDGNAASGTTGGAALPPAATFYQVSGSGGNGIVGAGAGNPGASMTNCIYGGSGGNGGSSGVNAGGNGGAPSAPTNDRDPARTFPTVINMKGWSNAGTFTSLRANGSGGGSGGSVAGGTSGAGGGGAVQVTICFKTIDNTNGTISANGGAGSNAAAGNAGGGGGGGAALVYLLCNSIVQGTIQANGGAKGLKAGTGNDGVDGSGGHIQISYIS